MAKKIKSYTFPIVTWDDVDGRDVWVGDATASIDDPLAAQYENEELLAALAEEFGGECFVVRSLED